MKREERSVLLYLDDMLLSMHRINEYIDSYTFEKFRTDSKTVDAVIRNFEILGEASKKLPTHFKERFEEVPWAEMYKLRNKVSHEYFGIDYEIIWDISKNHLPINQLQIENILKDLEDDNQ